MSIGNFPESLGQGILVGMILVGRLGISQRSRCLSTAQGTAADETVGCGKEKHPGTFGNIKVS